MAIPLKEYLAAREERMQALLHEGAPREHLLEELRQTLRGIRDSLPTYRRVQETARYNMTLEDIEDHEQRYAQLKDDNAGIHYLEDYAEALINAQDTSAVITNVLSRSVSGPSTEPVMTKRRSTWWLVFVAAVIFFIARACAGQ